MIYPDRVRRQSPIFPLFVAGCDLSRACCLLYVSRFYRPFSPSSTSLNFRKGSLKSSLVDPLVNHQYDPKMQNMRISCFLVE